MPTSDIAFTEAVKAAQQERGSRNSYAKMEARGGWETKVTPALRDFIAARDSFYLGTASADGQPYIQHRGGPRGFLKVLDERTLGYADFRGNLQLISTGNLRADDRVAILGSDRSYARGTWHRVEHALDDYAATDNA